MFLPTKQPGGANVHRGGVGAVLVFADFVAIAHPANHPHQALLAKSGTRSHTSGYLKSVIRALTSDDLVGTALLGQRCGGDILAFLSGYRLQNTVLNSDAHGNVLDRLV